jgi:hypothetical protein
MDRHWLDMFGKISAHTVTGEIVWVDRQWVPGCHEPVPAKQCRFCSNCVDSFYWSCSEGRPASGHGSTACGKPAIILGLSMVLDGAAYCI